MDLNISVLQILIKYQMIEKDAIEDLENAGKLGFENVTFG